MVVGAGASAGLGLPVGSLLKHIISGLLTFEFEWGDRLKTGDAFLAKVLREGERDDVVRRFKAAALVASDVGLARSIDDFININQGDADIEYVGKLAITRAILQAEKGSEIFFEPGFNNVCFETENLENDWHYLIFQMLQVPRSEIENLFENVKFLIFNYDRCVEHFLYCLVRRFYRLSDEDASLVMSKAKFYHPYGLVGRLPWMSKPSDIPVCSYGGGVPSELFKNIAAGLKTYSESISDGNELTAIRSSITGADKIVFLGFAFHPQNMALLQPSESSEARFTYFTAKDVSRSHIEIIRRQIDRLCGAKLQQVREQHLSMDACEVLISDYCRSIESS